MERTRIAKVDQVTLSRKGEQLLGELHLLPHHIVFANTPSPRDSNDSSSTQRPRELWITYPMISFCTLRTAPPASRQPSSIRLRCRDFTFVCFYFASESQAGDVYDTIRAWTCKLGRIEKLYAFTYQPKPPEKNFSSWGIYDPMKEWRRLGIGDPSRNLNWRISTINRDYAFSPTYPALLPVPSSISDNTLNYAGRYRSRARIPVLTYLHPVNNCSVTRSSQPMVGVRQNRSIQDEKLLAAIFSTTRPERPLSSFQPAPLPEREESGSSKEGEQGSLVGDLCLTNSEALENAVIAKVSRDEEDAGEAENKGPVIYGAQQRNMIIDARPTVNAYAMQAVGLGSENMDNYKFATKAYLGIDNIHVMRDSLNKVVEALKDSDVTPLGPNRELLHKSHWLKHIANVLEGVGLIARQVGLQHSHVLIHCSDGWDRTSQLSALSQICLDPYYRTMEGFIVLVEKDWLSFGHQFHYRSGFLSSDKWFQIENERVGGIDGNSQDPNRSRSVGNDAMAGAQKTLESALLSAKGFFSNSKNNTSRDSLNIDSDSEQMQSCESDSPANSRRGGPNTNSLHGHGKSARSDKYVTKVKETAPIFHQFLDATYQLLYQYPTRFEFNERFLRRLLYHLYSCQYGTFLYDNEKSRKEAKISERTKSVWDYFLCRKDQFLNPKYDAVIDDNIRGRERLIFPRTEEVRWWNELFGRTDEEMNAKTHPLYQGNGVVAVDSDVSSSVVSHSPGTGTPVLTGVEAAEQGVVIATQSKQRESGQGVDQDASRDQQVAEKIVDDLPASSRDPLGDLAVDVGHMVIRTAREAVGTGRKGQSGLRDQLEFEME